MRTWRLSDMETGMDPRLAMGAAEQQDLAARSRMAENLAQSGGDDEAKRAKMRQACEGFESIFIQKMWEQMRATLPKEGLMKSKEEEFWMSMYDQELAKSIAGSGGIGLADMMMVQLDRTNASIGDASRNSPSRRTPLDVRPAPLLPSSSEEARSAKNGETASSLQSVGESRPGGVFAGAADRPGAGKDSAAASIYDGAAPTEAPADNPAGMNVAQASGLPAPGQNGAASSTRTDVDTSGSGQARIGNEKAEQSSAEAADDPIRQTLDELRNTVAAGSLPSPVTEPQSGRSGEKRNGVSLASSANPRLTLQQMKGEAPVHKASSGTGEVRQNGEAPSEGQPASVIRVTYQTNLPPNQRSTSAEKMLKAMREAQRPTPARGISSGSPYEAEPLKTASVMQPAPAPVVESEPVRKEPEVPADPLAGIQPRYVPSRFSNPLYAARSQADNFAVAMTDAVRPSYTSANATITAMAAAQPIPVMPEMIAPVQSGGPALAEPEVVRGAVALGNPEPDRGSLGAPVSGGISSGFGWRIDPFTGRRSWHAGVDIKAEPGEAVRAAMDGVVSFVGRHPELGNLVVVDHGNGLRTFYGHNSSLDVSVGQPVSAGMELARAGSSGRASGTHVHFEVRRGDLALNPEPLIRQGNTLLADAGESEKG